MPVKHNNRDRSVVLALAAICLLTGKANGDDWTVSESNTTVSSGTKVGIGTSNPANILDVKGTSSITASSGTERILDLQYGTTRMFDFQSADFGSGAYLGMFNSAGTLVNKFDARANQPSYFMGGSVGIGTSTPTGTLDVRGTSLLYGKTVVTGNTAGEESFVAKQNMSTGDIAHFRNIEGTKVVINNAGRVGIGTTSPGYMLDVIGNARFSSTLTAENGLGLGNSYSSLQSTGTPLIYGLSNGYGAAGDLAIAASTLADRDILFISRVNSQTVQAGRVQGGTGAFEWNNPVKFLSTLDVTGIQTNATDLVLAATTAQIRTNSADVTDNKRLVLASASGASPDRGAHLALYGNEFSGVPGDAHLIAGAEGSVRLGYGPNSAAGLTVSNTGAVSIPGALNINGAVPSQNHGVIAKNKMISATGDVFSIRHYGEGSPSDVNSEYIYMQHTGGEGRISVTKDNGFSFRPLTFYTADTKRYEISPAGLHTMTGSFRVTGDAVIANALEAGPAIEAGIAGGFVGYKDLGAPDKALTQFSTGVTVLNAKAGTQVNVAVGNSVKMIVEPTIIKTLTDFEVGGDLIARNWKIDAPDYVFEKEYDLASLDQVESFVKKNKHLPEVPSAKQMKKEGLDLVKMNFNLLKKVEELTLYVIEQNKRTQAHEKRSLELEKEILDLRKSLATISKVGN